MDSVLIHPNSDSTRLSIVVSSGGTVCSEYDAFTLNKDFTLICIAEICPSVLLSMEFINKSETSEVFTVDSENVSDNEKEYVIRRVEDVEQLVVLSVHKRDKVS